MARGVRISGIAKMRKPKGFKKVRKTKSKRRAGARLGY